MKNPNPSCLLAGLCLLGALPLQAQTTITIDNLRVIPTGGLVQGSPSEGTLVANGAFPGEFNQGTPTDAPIRIDGLDLDGVGGNDDYIDFTLRFEATRDSNPQVNWTGAGQGVTGDLSPGNLEELTITVVDIVAKPGLAGFANFDGFTAASLYLGGSGIITDGEADINGTPVADTFDATGGFTFNVTELALPGTPATVVIDNVVASDGDFRFRQCDISITYDPNALPPPVTVTSVGTNLRNDNVYPTVGGPLQGGASIGDIIPNPDATYPPAGSPATDFPLRWTGLDLDSDGLADDYFNFSIRFTNASGIGENIATSNQGVGVKGGAGGELANDNLNDGDEILVEVVDIQVSPGLVGSVIFDGFSAAGLGAGVGASGGAVSIGCDINGQPVFIDLPDNLAYQYATDKATFASLISTVLFDNVNETADLKNPTGRVRELDMQFTYDASVAPPPVSLTTNDLNLRNDAAFTYPDVAPPGPGKGGSNLGNIVAQPGFDATAVVAAPTIDLLCRWQDLDLDNSGSADDYIDFTVRFSSGTADNVSFGGEGIGISGNGSAGIDPGEVLTAEIVNIQLSPGTLGSVTFGGFSEAGFFASGSAGAGNPTSGDATCDINGNTVMINLNGTGYTNQTVRAAFGSPTSTVVFDNATYTAGTITPVGRARDFDFAFTYSQSGAPLPDGNLRISSVTFNSGDLTITTVDVVDGATYHLEHSPDLTTPFAPLAGSEQVGAGGQLVHVVSVGGADKGFYRVVEGPIP
ncbi:hypothetical protein HAHE_01150 [Haloferula helveola]|uniref:Uncharacterized protein n=1 Tax=Haloferula helveola TaxID=490095 RepID=A0ABN6GZG7_9BACT|nr:hypothetical protein HAHE_01150 [Haloferula helveola]